MYTMDQLEKAFDLTLTPGNLKNSMRLAGAKSGDLWKVRPSQLREIEGFNVRLLTPRWHARVRELANSMKRPRVGYMLHKPMAGFVGKDAAGEDTIYVTDGYTRLAAIKLANSELPKDKQIELVSVVTHDAQKTTMVELNTQLISGNRENALSPYESAIVIERLAKANLSIEAIAEHTDFSTEWVQGLLSLIAAPQGLRRMVADDVITATFAIDTIKEHGDKAFEVLQEALAQKVGAADDADGETTKVRLTKKDMIPKEVRKFNNAVKKSAPGLYSALADVKKDPNFAALAPETRDKLAKLMERLEKLEVPGGLPSEEPAVDPRQNPLFDADAPEGGAGEQAA